MFFETEQAKEQLRVNCFGYWKGFYCKFDSFLKENLFLIEV